MVVRSQWVGLYKNIYNKRLLTVSLYLLDGVKVDVDNFVEIFGDDFSDLSQRVEVKRLVWRDKHVNGYRRQITHSHLQDK